jgi:hypothetical protein
MLHYYLAHKLMPFIVGGVNHLAAAFYSSVCIMVVPPRTGVVRDSSQGNSPTRTIFELNGWALRESFADNVMEGHVDKIFSNADGMVIRYNDCSVAGAWVCSRYLPRLKPGYFSQR